MATLHTALNTLPEDRAELYEQCIVLLLERWEKRRETSSITSGQPRVEEGIIKELNISRIQLEEVLQRLAFEMHLRQGRQRGRTLLEKAEISGAQLRSALDPLLDPERGADIFIRYIKNRAGLLADRGLDRYVFPHRTFQEFLAARHILNQDEAADELAQLARSDHIWWYEVFLLAVGYCRKTMDYARLLIDRLCSADYANGTITEEEAHASLLAAHAAVDLRLQTQVAKASTGRLVRRLQRWLVGILVHSAVPPLEQIEAGPYQPQAWLVDIIKSNVLPPIERAEVGRHLSQLGDMRPDVNCEIPWVIDISSGEFIMGSEYYYDERPQHNVILPNYRIGKYPVTNAQYHRFVDDGGYTKKHFDCWTQAGWSWLERDKIRQPGYWGNPQWTLDNHPVVGVSWYEAVAYCKWLSKTNTQGRVYRLPSEAEWEKAARGTDGREWPWGNKFDPIMANTVEGSVGRTTAVGIYPQGRSQFGVQDTAGNVWEWCSSRWGKDAVGLEFEYPYRADDGRENRDSEDNRIQRGGSWNDAASRAACADRDKLAPNSQHFDVGFRIAE
jgi:formylglycine-generating enzyme required for sulfatase activity